MKLRPKAVIWLVMLILAVSLVLGLLLERTIKRKIERAGVTAKSIQLSLFSRKLFADSVSIPGEPDLYAGTVNISGIDFLSVIFHNRISVGTVSLDTVLVHYDQSARRTRGDTIAIDGLEIAELKITALRAEMRSDSGRIATVQLDLGAKDFMWFKSSGLSYESMEAELANVVLGRKEGLYETRITRVRFNGSDRSIEWDSLQLTPLEGKYEFARKLKRQATRTSLVIPRITMTGINLQALRDTLFSASVVELHEASLWAFRDKRLPFRNPYIPLPLEMSRQLKFMFHLDTLRIVNAEIRYEEFDEEGKEPGHVDFHHLHAEALNFSNHENAAQPGSCIIKAQSELMGSGTIQVTFVLPLDGKTAHRASGKIVHGNLRELNAMIEPVAFKRIESGKLNRIDFDFEYNEENSRGTVKVNYEDLRISELNKDDREVNALETLLMNAFLKNKKNGNTPVKDRTGVIRVQRDKRRFVTNLWAKSLLKGIESGLD